jgi:hypothetical protein
VHREKSKTKLSFRVELHVLESNHPTTTREDACQEWWDKLKSFPSVSSYHGFASGTKDDLAEDQLVHSALIILEIPPSLIQFLIRMAPNARHEPELRTRALPIHLACKYILYPSKGKNLQVLCLLMGRDSDMCQKLYRYWSPLQLAILARNLFQSCKQCSHWFRNQQVNVIPLLDYSHSRYELYEIRLLLSMSLLSSHQVLMFVATVYLAGSIRSDREAL